MMTVTIIGLEPVIAKLEGLGRPEVLRTPMVQATAHLQDVVVEYPRLTQANRPPGRDGYRWYERGFGTRTVTGRAYNTSERLGEAWTTKVSHDGREGSVGNDTTYGPYVQDAESQVSFHKTTGWKTIQDVVEKESDKIVGYFEEEYRRYLSE